MKIKSYKNFINEGVKYKTREQIESWLDSMEIDGYIIKDDLTVDVTCSIENLSNKNLSSMPIKFDVIEGYFTCNHNKLTTLEGCPNHVCGDFFCYDNKLTSLEHCPKKIDGYFDCSSNKLTSLVGCPEFINGDFLCHYNQLTSLEHCPKKINGELFYYNNPLTSLDGLYPEFDLLKINIEEEKYNLAWAWLETNLSTDTSLIKYNIEWIKKHENTMTETFKKEFGYLVEIYDYSKIN